MSDPQRPYGLQPTRLLRPWDFPGRSTRVGCHCLLQHHLYQWPNLTALTMGEMILGGPDTIRTRHITWYSFQKMHNHTSNRKDAIKKGQNCGTFCKTTFTSTKAKTKKTWRTCSRIKDRDITTKNNVQSSIETQIQKNKTRSPARQDTIGITSEICMRTIYLTNIISMFMSVTIIWENVFFLKRYLTKFLEGSVLMSVIYSQMIQRILNCIIMRVMK